MWRVKRRALLEAALPREKKRSSRRENLTGSVSFKELERLLL
jgi:hypothetical protein